MDTILEAVNLVENDQIEKGLKLLKSYVDEANDDEKFTISELYIQWGFLEDAAIILKGLVKKYPDENELKMSLVDIYIENEQDDKALDILSKVDKDTPEYIQALIQMADLYQAQGLYEVSEQKLLEAKNKLPNETLIDFALGELYFSIGEYIKAINYYENVAKEHEVFADVSLADRLGESLAAIGEYEKALDYYHEDEKKNPDKLFKYGMTAHQADRNDIAIKAWSHVAELDPFYHSVYYYLAVAQEEEGILEQAFNTAVKGIGIDEFNKELYMLAGTLAHKLGKSRESEDYIRKAIALDTDFKEAILFLIEFLKEQNRYKEIIELIIEIQRTGAEDALYDWELARAFNEDEQYQEALKSYEKAFVNLHDDSDFLKEYGYFLTEDGHHSEAIRIFESYLKQVPGDYNIEEYLLRLKQSEEN